MTDIITKGLISKEDIAGYDGSTKTFNRKTSTGGTQANNYIDWVGIDVFAVYGARTDTAISNAIKDLDTSTQYKLFLDSGDWQIDTSISFASLPNVFFDIAVGATFSQVTGDETITFYSPENIIASPRQQITSVNMLAFANGGTVYSGWWGAVADGATDDYAAIQAAVDSGATEVLLPSGESLLSDVLTINENDVALIGASMDLSILTATHTGGAVLRVIGDKPTLKKFTIGASSARESGGGTSDYGILIEPLDTAGARIRHLHYDRVAVINQPSHGVVVSGGVYVYEMRNSRFEYNAGHGLVLDNGSITSRVNDIVVPGLGVLENLELVRNDGNGLVIGNEANTDNRGVRITIINCEIGRNAEAAGTRLTAHQAYIFSIQTTIMNCAFHAGTIADADVGSGGGAYVIGQSVTMLDNRFLSIESTANAVYVADGPSNFSKGIRIIGVYLSNVSGLLDPCIYVESNVDGLTAETDSRHGFASFLRDTYTGTNKTNPIFIQKRSVQVVNNSTTLVNDSELFMSLDDDQTLNFELDLFVDGDAAADIKFAFTAPSGATIRWAPVNGIKVDTSLNVAQQGVTSVSGTSVDFGTNGSGIINIKLVGYVETNGTSGNLQFQFAQNAAVVADTRIRPESIMKAWGS